jgi:hypothetical protein
LVADEFAELLDLLLMATWAEIALLAAEGDQVVAPAMVAAQSGESAAQVAAGLEGVERGRNFQAESAFPFLESGTVLLVKRLSMGRQALPAATHADAGNRHASMQANKRLLGEPERFQLLHCARQVLGEDCLR